MNDLGNVRKEVNGFSMPIDETFGYVFLEVSSYISS